MIENKSTLGSIETSVVKKQRLAKASLEYNVRTSKEFCKLFPEYVERYNEQCKNGANDSTDSLGQPLVDDVSTQLPRNIMAAVAWVIAVLSIVVAVRFA